MRISGCVALVTGGGNGLGAATARALAERGAHVALIDRDRQAAEAVAAPIGALGVGADVTDAGAIEAAIDRVCTHFGAPPRIVVNCAGIAVGARIVGRDGALSIDAFERVIGVNLTGSYIVMSHAVRAMLEAEPFEDGARGVVVNTASAAYEDGQIGQSAYAASKGAIAAMSLPAARELARFGIRVVAVAPGLFATPMVEALPEATRQTIARDIPFPARLGEPAEFALLVCQIVDNAYLNGTVIRLDGAVRLPQR